MSKKIEKMYPRCVDASFFQVHHINGLDTASNGETSGEGIDSMVYFRALLPVCEKLDLK